MNAASRFGADGPHEDPDRHADHAWPAMDALRIGCIACDADGRMVRWNDAAAALLGTDLLRRPLGRWTDHATFRGDDGREIPASALPFGPSATHGATLAERLLVVERPGAEPIVLAALVQPWSIDGAAGSLTFIRSAERARRIADAGRERIIDLERRLRRQVALVRTGRVAGSAGEDRTRLPRLLEQLAADLPADAAGIVLVAEEPENRAVREATALEAIEGVVVATTRGAEDGGDGAAGEAGGDMDGRSDAASVIRRLHESGAGDWVRAHRRPLTVTSPALDPFLDGRDTADHGPVAWAAVPLTAAGEASVGVLYALHEHERQYDADDLAYLEAVADQAAGAIVRSRLIGRLRGQTEELTAHRDRLEHLVAERTRDLAETHARLRVADRLAAIGTFTAGLGHDMENVLFPLRCRLDAIAPGELPEAGPLAATIEATRDALGFLRDLADGLRLFARDPLDGPADASTDPAAWWSRVAPLIRHAIAPEIEIDASIPSGLPPVRVPAAGLTQAILNLVVNAADAGAPGGTIRIEASLDPADAGRLWLRVRDDGRGMAPEVAAQAFDPFFSTRTRTVSTGLGLWLVHQVVERAGGHIDVDTAPGRGTAITLQLPVAGADDPVGHVGHVGHVGTASDTSATTASLRAAGTRVAIDDQRRRAWIIRVVEEAGGHLTSGDDAALLIRDAETEPPDDGPDPRHEIRLGGPPSDSSSGPANRRMHYAPDPDDLATIRRLITAAIADLVRPDRPDRAAPPHAAAPPPSRPESDR